ncbi:hypothetical protein [Mesonia maritima]|uniref:Uncharacterized protein n=1 Tax=Mesonia maritima TaxID=1793873 RepID=A0ABU1K3G2_9FLAO|nr:hypothetical protein [Mesonia maritima]MDR6300155.1 hypothetical protein [Mesonia maritima]
MKHLCFLIFFIAVQSFSQSFQGTPFSLSQQFNGNYDFTAIGNTLNPNDNVNNFGSLSCNINNSSSATLNLNPNQTVEAAYLYWSGSGPETGNETVQLNGNNVTSTLYFNF